MSLNIRSFTTTVSTAVTAAQAACTSLLDLSIGTPGRALLESVAATALWLQYMMLQLLLVTRLATSSGSDADSFVNDFGMERLAGVAATGNVTMTSFTPAQSSAVVIPGTLVRTVSGVTYSVVQDSTLSIWSSASGGYVREEGVSSITVPIQAADAGSSGNVDAGAICLMGTTVSGIDTVTNEAAVTNGSDQETDVELRARFPLWLSGRATASRNAVASAIAGVQNGLTYELIDGRTPDGVLRPGYFTVVVDDGSGTPSDDLQARVRAAINATKALGVQFAIQAPNDVILNISMTVTVPDGTDRETVSANIATAIAADISARQVGAGYPASRLTLVAYNSAGVSLNSILNVLINGEPEDIAAADKTVVRPGTVQVLVEYG